MKIALKLVLTLPGDRGCPGRLISYRNIKNDAGGFQSEKMESKSAPNGTKREPEDSQGQPKGNQREPEGNQKGAKREPKGYRNASKSRSSEKVAKGGAKRELLGAKAYLKRVHFGSQNGPKIIKHIDPKIDAEKVLENDPQGVPT